MATNWKKLKEKQGKGIEPAGIDEFESTDKEIAEASIGYGTGKQTISIRLDSEIVRYFKSLGPGYQTRMNNVLLNFVAIQKASNGLKPQAPGPAPSSWPSAPFTSRTVCESASVSFDNNQLSISPSPDNSALLVFLYHKDGRVKASVDQCAAEIAEAVKRL